MSIQWFPGHMFKAVKLIEANLKIVDAVIYVIDSRAVSACINPSFDSLIKNKPILYCFSKIDMVEQPDIKKWYEDFDKRGLNYVASNSTGGHDSVAVMRKLRELMSEKTERYREKGVSTPIRSMVIGIPNSGKSTLINSLCGGKKTLTGDRPGITRNKQWLAVESGIDMLDTPGTLWPKLEDQKIAKDLAFIGSIRDDIIDTNDLALDLIDYLMRNHFEKLKERYGISELGETPLLVYEQIAASRGYLLKGAEVDYDRAGHALIDDFRKQRIGKIMLEFPN
ncbi:MAG: ribosome biogenesis GTPase YlqF [Clostridia bacterium]